MTKGNLPLTVRPQRRANRDLTEILHIGRERAVCRLLVRVCRWWRHMEKEWGRGLSPKARLCLQRITLYVLLSIGINDETQPYSYSLHSSVLVLTPWFATAT